MTRDIRQREQAPRTPNASRAITLKKNLSEVQQSLRAVMRAADFRFRISLGFRISDFGFRILPALGFALLTGCAHYQPRPLSPAQNASALQSRSFDDPEFRAFLAKNLNHDPDSKIVPWPLPKTWDLDTLLLAAFYFQPDLEVARAQWRLAQAGVKTAGGRPNPSLNATPGYNFSHINAAPGLSPWFPSVTLDVPVETAGKRGKRIAAAESFGESARLNVAAIAWQVRSNLRVSLLDFTAARQREALLDKQLAFQEQIVALLRQRLQAGAVTSSEVALARVALEKTRLDLNDARRQRAESRERVAEAVGVPLAALNQVEFSFGPLDRHVAADDLLSEEARRQALQGRSDILGALADYAASQSALQLEIAKQYPDVHLSPGYQYDQGDNKWSLGVTVELPVLNQNQGPIAEAKARREETAALFNALQAKVLAGVERAVEVYRVSEQSVTSLQSMAAAQNQQRESVAAQFKAGAADQLDLLNAEFEFGASQLVRLDGEIKLQQALGLLEDALQRPMDLPEAFFQPQHTASQEVKKDK